MVAKNDPLENAKITKEKRKKGDSGWFGKKNESSASQDESEKASSLPEEGTEPMDPAEDPPEKKAAPVAAESLPKPASKPSLKRYRIKKDRKISIKGCMTMVRDGSIVTDRDYGSVGGVQFLIDQGVELEVIE